MPFFSDVFLEKTARRCGFMEQLWNIGPPSLVLSLIAALSKGNCTSIADLHRQFNGMCLSEKQTVTSRLEKSRYGLDQALAAVRHGDTLVVTKLDRLARSVPDARDIADSLQARGIKLALGQSIYDPTDPLGKMVFNVAATFAEFEGDLIRLRTKEGMAIARAKGKLRGKQPKLSNKQQKELCRMHRTGEYSISNLTELFSVSRPKVYRTLTRSRTENNS